LEQDDTFPRLKVVKYDLKKVRDLPHGTFFGIFFLLFFFSFHLFFFFMLDIEVIVYKAGCVVDVRKGELRKLELEVFDASMKPGETVLEWNFPFIFICFLFFFKLSCLVW
jgi:hypothetical protein